MADHEVIFTSPTKAHRCEPYGYGTEGEIRKCKTCGKWWISMAPEYASLWTRLRPWHVRAYLAAQRHDNADRMPVIVHGEQAEDR